MRIAEGGWLPYRRPVALVISLGLVSVTLPDCHWLDQEQVLYERQGVQIGLQADPSIPRASQPTANTHPIDLTPQEIMSLLGAVRVSGWSGTVIGWFDTPRAIPLFDETDLQRIAQPIAEAFKQAAPHQRVFFSLPNPRSAYGDTTAGALFIRGPYLHVIVTDHKAFARADTAGGDEKDIRDTKGMRLSLASSRTASLTKDDEPAWAPFESVHLSMNRKEVLGQGTLLQNARRAAAPDPLAAVPTQPAPGGTDRTADPAQELRLQIRELTQSNQDLRDRLAQQSQQLQDLKDELARLRRDSEGTRAKKPAVRKPAAP
jgi:hypothetical protein